MPQDLLPDPDLAVGIFRLLAHPPGDLHRRRQIARQRRLNRLQMRLADGCRLDRDIRALVAVLPFSSAEVAESYLEKTPKTHGYLYRGSPRSERRGPTPWVQPECGSL